MKIIKGIKRNLRALRHRVVNVYCRIITYPMTACQRERWYRDRVIGALTKKDKQQIINLLESK